MIFMNTEGSNWQYPSIGLDNGLAPNRWQAIIWTNVDLIHWRVYAALGGDGLNSIYSDQAVFNTLKTQQNDLYFDDDTFWQMHYLD